MTKQDKYKGTLIGLAIGDVLGTPFEFWKKEKVQEHLSKHELEVSAFERGGQSFPAGFFTDDTSQMICLAESLIKKGFDLDDQYDRYKKWFLSGYATPLNDKAYGVGQHTLKILLNDKPTPKDKMDGSDKNAGGNGSLMRCAPIGLYYQWNYDEIKNKSLQAGYLTHNNLIAGWCCVALNAMLSLIIEGTDKLELQSKVEQLYLDVPKELKVVLDEGYHHGDIGPDDLPISGYSLDTFRIALWAFIGTENFADAIKKVVLLGGDTDTFGAVAGALAGCYYGYRDIPQKWSKKVIKADEILSLSEQLFEKRHKQ